MARCHSLFDSFRRFEFARDELPLGAADGLGVAPGGVHPTAPPARVCIHSYLNTGIQKIQSGLC